MNLLRWGIDQIGATRLQSYAGCMFEGLSRQEIIGWLFCLTVAVGLTVFGSAYLVASSYMSADVSEALRHPDIAKQSQQPSLP
jgi:hypothetical protein